jgi:geranylgeranyl diphosphate synthase type 3
VLIVCARVKLSVKVAHSIYGIPQAINSANYVYFLAYHELSKLRSTPSTSASGKGKNKQVDVEGLVNGSWH